MDRAARDTLLDRLSQHAQISDASRTERLRRLPVRLLLPRVLRASQLTCRVTTTTFYGRSMRVHLPDLVGTKLYQYGFFEADLTRAIIDLVPTGGVFVDIGSHVGYYAALASLLVGSRGRVIAFEPTPRTRTELSWNTADLPNVSVVPLAAWDEPAQLVLQDFGWRQSSFNSVAAPRLHGSRHGKAIEVEAVAADEWLGTRGIVPDFIKIDAESAEHRVLRGLERTIRTHHPIISVEIGDYDLADIPCSADIVRSLLDLGYSAWQHRGGKLVRHRLAERYTYDNLIFLPTKH